MIYLCDASYPGFRNKLQGPVVPTKPTEDLITGCKSIKYKALLWYMSLRTEDSGGLNSVAILNRTAKAYYLGIRKCRYHPDRVRLLTDERQARMRIARQSLP